MLRKFAAVLLATSLIAGPVFAAGIADTTPAPASVGATVAKAPVVKTVKSVKHSRKHARKHARGTAVAMNQVRHVKHSRTSHRVHAAKIASKHAIKGGKHARVHTAKLPATRTGTN